VATEDQDLEAEDHALDTEVLPVMAAENQILAAEDQVLGTAVQLIMAAEDQTDKDEDQCVHASKQEEDQTVREESTAGITIAHKGGEIPLACRKRPNIIVPEKDVLPAGIVEAIPNAGDSLEYKHVEENETVPAEPVEVQDKDHEYVPQSSKDLIQDNHIGIQATKKLNSKMRTSTRPDTGRQASRSGVREPNKKLAICNRHEYWLKTTNSTASIFFKVHSMMIDTEKDVETDASITMNEQQSQERIKEQEDVHRFSHDAGLQEQIHRDEHLGHHLQRGSMTNIKQSSTIQEAVARSVKVPIINLDELILTKLNSGSDALTATTNTAVVINEDPYDQMMGEEDKMVKPDGATLPAANVCSPSFKSGVHENDEAANGQLAGDDDAEVTTEDAYITQPNTGRHWSKDVIAECGWTNHGTFCDCSREIFKPPMTVSRKKKVNNIVPVRWMKPVEITQTEYDKFYDNDVFDDCHKISRDQLEENLLKIVDQQTRPHITNGHPFIRDLLWGEEDIHTDKSADEIILMMIERDTQMSLHPLNDSANMLHLVMEKMRQTPDPDDENLIEVVGDDPEEEPPDVHTTKKEVKKMKLDTLSTTPKVFSAHEPQEITLYLINDNGYKGDMLTMTYKENGSIKDYKQYTMYTQHKAANRERKDAKTFRGTLMIGDTYKEDVLAVTFEEKDVLLIIDKAAYREGKDAKTFEGTLMIGDTYKEDMLAVTIEEKDVLLMFDNAYKEDMLPMSPQEDVDAENHMMGNKDLIEDGQDNIQKTNLVYKRGTKEDAKRLAVSAIASERGEKGA
jgi:hypothetical protein